MADGSITIDTELDNKGFEKGLKGLQSTTKSVLTALGIDRIIGKAISTISNSVDDAISRLDTLNNFPKVMSNLGIGAEDAEKSINKMSKKLAGLPTTLDDGAMAVQRFTSSNKDINKSTEYFLALNNALLARWTKYTDTVKCIRTTISSLCKR